MNLLFWLVRMSGWARRPPAARRLAVVLAVIALCLVLAGIEKYVGWPVWLGVNPPIRRVPLLR
ncbi:hypothetical protein [Solirhodobacter olei]|uniref:hypothetical protein n=1 Tax=Solirhodobacter olei TaxID=2493082 RepID=UPI000FD86407|nr:hypothetical protein [Solirhodobacter olei]